MPPKTDQRNSPTKNPPTIASKPKPGNESPLKDKYKDILRYWDGKVLERASGVFTLKLSLPAVVLTIAVAMYIQHVENNYEQKFADLMKYEGHMKKLKTLSEKVSSLEGSLSNLKARLIPIDERVVGIQKEIKTANDYLTNYEKRINLISDTSSKLEGELSKQQQRFTEMEDKHNNMDISISNISKNIASIEDQSNDVKEKITMAEKNQTSLKALLNETVERAEDVHKNVSKVKKRISEVLIHLPTIEKINKSVPVIMKIDHQLPQLQRRLNENKVRVHGLELEVNNTESRFDALKEKSESVIDTVSLAMAKQTDIENKVKMSNEDIVKLKQNMFNTDENIEKRLKKITGDIKTSESKFLDTASKLNNEISTTEGRTEIMVKKVDEYNGKLEQFKSDVHSLSDDVNQMKPNVNYIGSKVKDIDIQVRNLQSQNTGIDVYQMVAFILIGVLFCLILHTHFYGGTQFRAIQSSEPHLTSSFMPQKPQSILDRIHRVPVLQNKVCVLSFYSETMNLHKKLVDSALATSRKGNSMEVIHHLVKKHEDILSIPSARYIFVFVDFNERNVILENPGQDLGDKKLVTVQAAQKIGADVFVTYVRDKGSNQLFPGNLYNQELSAFTSHHELKRLENNQRCFSVYETFNNTQKESIVRSIL